MGKIKLKETDDGGAGRKQTEKKIISTKGKEHNCKNKAQNENNKGRKSRQ
jgi:hypothetical protein